MEAYQDQLLDSPSKNSYIGSYYQPPDRLSPPSYVWEAPAPLTKTAMNLQNITPQVYRTTPDAGSKAVIAALKTLQEKIRRLELERKQAEKNVKQFSQAAHGYECSITPCNTTETDGSRKKERVTPLQSAEARCQLLEKQLDYMRKMVENAEKDKNTLTEKQRKIELLEQKLLEEEHERKLVQEKADELQRELETNLRLCPAVPDEVKPKKKSKNASKKTSLVRQEAPAPPCFPKNKLPFVAGTSTSPSHSVHANMQSVLHMMKHHQPHLCERVRSLRRSGSAGARRALHRAPSTNTSPPGPAGPALGSLSELLLALQDELGQMSFEHQELVCQMDETRRRDTREDLERELELLVKRMEEKGSQITKLRKHQQTVDKLTQNPQKPRQRATSEDGRAKGGSGVRPLPPSPVKTTSRGGKRAGVSQEENLQLLRETQRLCTSLKKDDITWET
ncbi:centrosomal protein CEP57L1 isoform X4 [Salvelinus namaycush]|uniref:Centrosomal protein 57kDa-like protein 1 n=1 Tax=Salvelinus namaycush TaxID=8040 RepID=A0A8U0P6B1_SALNM|nr:centrosomal protein CEP57L1 isoform X4 [Salvelinus namaycush]